MCKNALFVFTNPELVNVMFLLANKRLIWSRKNMTNWLWLLWSHSYCDLLIVLC